MKAKILLLIGLLIVAGCSASADADKHGGAASVGVGDQSAPRR
jgi:Tfp pilus assembly protein PilP